MNAPAELLRNMGELTENLLTNRKMITIILMKFGKVIECRKLFK